MDNTVYIDLDSFTISSSAPGNIHCDREIAEVIIELNKKGYKTIASCAGHNRSGSISRYFIPESDYDEWIETFGEHPSVVRVEKYDDRHFVCLSKELITTTYVAFTDNYEFDSLPEGFEKSELEDGISLNCRTYYYLDEEEETWQKMKTQKQIDTEIKNARARLLAWAKELKPVKMKGMNI